MWFCAAVCIARSSVILYSALSGASCTAVVYSLTAASQFPFRAASCPLRYARLAAQPAVSAAATISTISFCFINKLSAISSQLSALSYQQLQISS